MPVIDTGTHRCPKCSRIFEWEYSKSTRDHMSQSYYHVEKMPNPKLQVHRVSRENRATVYWKNCPHCGFNNEIRMSAQDAEEI